MARPTKQGLDYFPFDIDFFEDEKITAISGEFGIKGEITVIKLLCAIYRNGYFILWNDLLKYKLVKNLPGISSELIESIVNRLVVWEFFDKNLFDSVKVLTSKGIQRRYFSATKRRFKQEEMPYLLISDNKNEVIVCNNHEQPELLHTITTQSKEKESKENNIPPISTDVDIAPQVWGISEGKKQEEKTWEDTNLGYPHKAPSGKKEKSCAQKERKAFVPPSLQQVSEYCREKGYTVDPWKFVNYYTSNGWRVGRNPMKDWQAAVRTWQSKENENGNTRLPSTCKGNPQGHRGDTKSNNAENKKRELTDLESLAEAVLRGSSPVIDI